MLQLLSSAARTATFTGAAGNGYLTGLGKYNALQFMLDVTTAATLVGDTTDVFIQTTHDLGVSWVDVVHFTQLLGNGGAKRYFAKIVAALAQTQFEDGTALGAAAERHLLGDEIRVRTTVAGSPNFTFSIHVNPIGRRSG